MRCPQVGALAYLDVRGPHCLRDEHPVISGRAADRGFVDPPHPAGVERLARDLLSRRVMTGTALRFACAALVASGWMVVCPAGANEVAGQAYADGCGRDSQLEAARDALARGERDLALEHLKKAEALMDACASSSEEDTSPDQAPAHAEPALALGIEAQSRRDLFMS